MLAKSPNSSGDTVQFVGGRYASGMWAVTRAYDRSVFHVAVNSLSEVYSVRVSAAAQSFGFGAGRSC
jgi:hypothetical protein